MTESNQAWAVVLAGGSGNRLRHLTTDARGVSVPKQYCSLSGGPSLLELAMRRAEQVVPRATTTTIVAKQHSQWWSEQLSAMPSRNVIVQPSNRGTGLGILLSVLSVLEHDPEARIVFLPSDHYVEKEYVLATATRNALELLHRFDRDIVMVGITPESADPELGYIVPGHRACTGVFEVERFVEKPQRSLAEEMFAARCYWNSFIFAARGRYLLSLFETLYPHEVTEMRSALRADRHNGSTQMLSNLYARLPEIDFSRHVVERSANRLKLVPVGACGWSDLGTPDRVAVAIRRLSRVQADRSYAHVEMPRRRAPTASVWNLAQAHASVATTV